MNFWVRDDNEWIIEREDGSCRNFLSLNRIMFRYDVGFAKIKNSPIYLGFKKAEPKELRVIFNAIFTAPQFLLIRNTQ